MVPFKSGLNAFGERVFKGVTQECYWLWLPSLFPFYSFDIKWITVMLKNVMWNPVELCSMFRVLNWSWKWICKCRLWAMESTGVWCIECWSTTPWAGIASRISSCHLRRLLSSLWRSFCRRPTLPFTGLWSSLSTSPDSTSSHSPAGVLLTLFCSCLTTQDRINEVVHFCFSLSCSFWSWNITGGK